MSQPRACLSLLCLLSAAAHAADEVPATRNSPAAQILPPSADMAAQQIASTNDTMSTDMETVIVTGDKLHRSETDSTSSVGARNARQIEESSMDTLEDVSSRMANVGTAQGLTIRGIPLYGPTGGDGKTATVTVDGVPQEGFDQSISGLSVWDADQVEVLRGPQSTNQGRNSLAGAVVMRTRDPSDTWDLRTLVSDGNHGSTRTAAAGGGALVPGFANFRLSFERYDRDGAAYNETRHDDDWAHNNDQTFRAKLGLTPIGDYRALITLLDNRQEFGDSYVEATTRDASDRISLANSPSFSKNHVQTAALEQTLPVGAFDITLLSTYLRADYGRLGDYDETEQALGENHSHARNHMFTQEARTNFELPLLGHDIKGVAGLYYSNESKDNANGYSLPLYYALYSTGLCAGALGSADVTLGQCAAVFSSDPEHFVLRDDNIDSHVRNRAAFFEFDYAIDAVTFTAGLRYDDEHQKRTLGNTTTGNDDYTNALLEQNGFGTEQSPDIKNHYSAWLPKIGLRYAFAADWMAGFTWQRGYRVGGISYSYLPASIGGGANPYDPEYTSNYELAIKGKPLDPLLVTVNTYLIDWNDQQVNVGTSAFDTHIINAGKSRLYGAEFEARGLISETLEVFVAAGYSHTEYLEFADADGSDYSGNRFPRSPKTTSSIGATWKPRAWIINADVVHEAGAYSTADNDPTLRTDSHTVVNGKISYQLPRGVRLYAYAMNLFDKDYTTYRLNTVVGRQAAVLGDARSFGAGLEWRL